MYHVLCPVVKEKTVLEYSKIQYSSTQFALDGGCQGWYYEYMKNELNAKNLVTRPARVKRELCPAPTALFGWRRRQVTGPVAAPDNVRTETLATLVGLLKEAF